VKRVLLVAALAIVLLATLAAPALANLSRKDQNDFRFKPDIKRSTTVRYRGEYLGLPAQLIRVNLNFYDQIAWRKVLFIEARFDTRGAIGTDYSVTWIKADFVEGGFGCWVQKGAGLIPGAIVLDETEVVASGRTDTSVTCTFPKLAMTVSKPIKWSAIVAADVDAPILQIFDNAPNRGWYPHL
jgi:hypothetical protein